MTNYNDKFMNLNTCFLTSSPKIRFRPSMFLFLTCKSDISVRSALVNVQQGHISGITQKIIVREGRVGSLT